jgi:hypothetical protein
MSVSERKIMMFGESSVSAFLAWSYDVSEGSPPHTAITPSKGNHSYANTEDAIILAVQKLCNF